MPLKNDPMHSTRNKSLSRDSKFLRSDGSSRDFSNQNNLNPYYNRWLCLKMPS